MQLSARQHQAELHHNLRDSLQKVTVAQQQRLNADRQKEAKVVHTFVEKYHNHLLAVENQQRERWTQREEMLRERVEASIREEEEKLRAAQEALRKAREEADRKRREEEEKRKKEEEARRKAEEEQRQKEMEELLKKELELASKREKEEKERSGGHTGTRRAPWF